MKPLNGLRILEFDGLGPVTFAGMMLADLGAEVLRLTRSESAGAAVFDQVGGAVLHRGRAAAPIDLKSPQDREHILQLVDHADAVIEGFRPGVMERLGYGPDVLAARNPRLVFGRVTGWGQDGPLANEVGHDLNYIGLSGVLHAMGDADRPPSPPLNLVGDYGGGAMLLVTGVLAALIEAKTTGRGRVVDAAMTDGSALLGGLFQALRGQGMWSDRRGANLLDGGAPFIAATPAGTAASSPWRRWSRASMRPCWRDLKSIRPRPRSMTSPAGPPCMSVLRPSSSQGIAMTGPLISRRRRPA